MSKSGTYFTTIKQAFRRVGFATLIVFLLVSAFLLVFIKVADKVTEGKTQTIDTAILLALREDGDPDDPWGPNWLEEGMRDVTALGGMGFLFFLTLSVAIYLLLKHKKRIASLMLVSVGSGLLLTLFLKELFDRPRPELVPHGSMVYTASFPSGHSMMAAVTYLTLAAILARMHKRKDMKIFFFAIAIGLTLAIGISRVYLGVHWPSDVLAGWTMGAAWALLIREIVMVFQDRGKIDRELETVRSRKMEKGKEGHASGSV